MKWYLINLLDYVISIWIYATLSVKIMNLLLGTRLCNCFLCDIWEKISGFHKSGGFHKRYLWNKIFRNVEKFLLNNWDFWNYCFKRFQYCTTPIPNNFSQTFLVAWKRFMIKSVCAIPQKLRILMLNANLVSVIIHYPSSVRSSIIAYTSIQGTYRFWMYLEAFNAL